MSSVLQLAGGHHATRWIDIAPVSSVPYYKHLDPVTRYDSR
jgi:hypothetical protein